MESYNEEHLESYRIDDNNGPIVWLLLCFMFIFGMIVGSALHDKLFHAIEMVM